jgi:hypothetical protein
LSGNVEQTTDTRAQHQQAQVGKAPIGEAPVGKTPIGKAPLVAKGFIFREKGFIFLERCENDNQPSQEIYPHLDAIQLWIIDPHHVMRVGSGVVVQ